MATNTDEDPDLESLRSAVLASLKTKSVTLSKSEAEESPTEITDEERCKDEKKNDMLEEDEEEDLHALRLAALKTKRDDGLPKEPKTAPTTFERQGNLISIQIVDPEEEKRKAEAERIAKAKAMAAAKAEVSKAAKPARFRRVESSDSENEEDDEEEEEEEELEKEEQNGSDQEDLSEDEKSVMSDSSSASSKSSSSSSSSSTRASSSSKSKSSESSSSESEESSSSSEDEKRSKTHSDRRVHVNAKTNDRPESNWSRERQAVRKGEISSQGKDEDKGKTSSSPGAKRSIKDRLGERQMDKGRSANRSSSRREDRGERSRNGGEREERRLERRRNPADAKNDHSKETDHSRKVLDRASRNERSREGKRGDLRDSLRHRGRDMPKPHGHLRTSDRSSDRREQNRHSLKDGDRRRRPDRKLELMRGRHMREKADSYSKNPSSSSLLRQHSRDKNVAKNREPSSQTEDKDLNSKNESDAESLSDIPLESEEEKGDSDAEDVRFRKGRRENAVKKQETESNSQSRIVMSLTLPTDSELKKADEEQRKDFKRRRTMEEIRDRNRSRPSSRDTSRRDRRPENKLSKSPEGRGTRPSDKNTRTLDQERRRPRPSDFVSESESEDDKARSGLRSLVSGSGGAKKNGKEVSGTRKREGDKQNSRYSRGSPDVKGRGDENRKRDRRERREKKSRRLVITEDASNQDQENGEDIVQKLSIRSRLGDRPTTTLRSSIKSRLGPKVSSPEDALESTELPEVQDRPKVRKIELSYENPDTTLKNSEQISNLERKTSSEDALVTKPNDLRHKMKRKLKRSSKDSEDGEQASRGESSRKRKVIKNSVWADILKERSEKGGRGDAPSTVRRRSTEREKKADKKEKRKEKSKTKEENVLEEKIKRMHEMNAAIMEKHKQIQKEKELFDC